MHGTGNSNDINVSALLEVYSRIDLVDIDNAALKAGVHRQLRDPEEWKTKVEVGERCSE